MRPVRRYGWHTSRGRELYAYGRNVGQAHRRVTGYLCTVSPYECTQYRLVDAEIDYPCPVVDSRKAPGA